MDFMAILTKIVAFFCSFLIPLSNGLNTLFNGDIYPFESNTKVIGLETFDRSQGVSAVRVHSQRLTLKQTRLRLKTATHSSALKNTVLTTLAE